MSGYIRGGVQMAYKATPTPLPTGATGGYASTSQQYQYAGVQQQQMAAAYAGGYVPRAAQPLRDDYERWYAEPTPMNRMLLSLRSGLDSEVTWALERLCRLSCNDQFQLSSIPGLVDALFEWPEWFLREYRRPSTLSSSTTQDSGLKGKKQVNAAAASLFAPSSTEERNRRYALESLFILRNAALGSQNASELSAHSKTRPLIIRALYELDLDSDENTQFVLYTLELLHCLAGTYVLPPAKGNTSAPNPVPVLEKLAGESSNRAIIISALSALTALFGIPHNVSHTNESSPALAACIRYLPLYQDTALVDACLNFFYAHLSYPPMTKAFLLHPDMPGVLKALVGYMVSQQDKETATLDISAPSHSVPSVKVESVIDDLSEEELQRIGVLSEPERCFEWLRTAIRLNPNEELTQVEFWNAYKDSFTQFQDRQALLPASDVIKNASLVYPTAQAMVLQVPTQKFIIRGISKRTKQVVVEQLVCHWDRAQCQAGPFETPAALRSHVKEHFETLSPEGVEDKMEGGDEEDSTPATKNDSYSCKWSTCQYSTTSLSTLIPHVWTHVPLNSIETDPEKLPRITLSSASEQFPMPDATQRPPPPEPKTVVAYPSPARDPPTGALTALLILRTLFRASFASSEVAPRVDADHFGFPGVVEEVDEQEVSATASGEQSESDREGERRGRTAFLGVRHLMESVHIKDPALMSWIYEMIDAGSTSTP